MTKYYPGPYRRDRGNIYDSKQRRIASVWLLEGARSSTLKRDATAALFAAAFDLLDAARELLDELETAAEGESPESTTIFGRIERVRALIAKAEGRKP